jgi:O-antigen/teichoic acid export membrane protein
LGLTGRSFIERLTVPSKLKTAVFWNTLGVIGNQVFGVAVTVILARLLLPEDFGLIGMVTIVTMIASVIIDGGISAAVIQKKQLSQVELSTLFLINVLLAVGIVGLVALLAPAIAAFFSEPEVVSILQVLSFSYFLGSLQVIHYGLMAKQMDFKSIGKIRLAAQLLAGLVAILLAWYGAGVWALVVQQIVSAATATALFWTLGRWMPSWRFDFATARQTFRFSGFLMVSSLINQLADNFYFVLIGKYFPAEQLGFYYQAHRVQRIPAQKIQQVVQQSTFPEFSRLAETKNAIVAFFQKSISNVLFVNLLAMGLLMVNAEDLVLWLLTEKWAAAIPYIQWLSLASFFLPVLALSRNFILGMGHSKMQLKVILINKILLIAVALVTIQFGIMGLIYGQVAVAIVFVGVYFSYIQHRYLVSMKGTWIILGKYTCVTLVALGVVYLLGTFSSHHFFVSIAIRSGLFMVAFLLLLRALRLHTDYMRYLQKVIKRR